jgi:hypothetical protein
VAKQCCAASGDDVETADASYRIFSFEKTSGWRTVGEFMLRRTSPSTHWTRLTASVIYFGVRGRRGRTTLLATTMYKVWETRMGEPHISEIDCSVCCERWPPSELRRIKVEKKSHNPWEGSIDVEGLVCPRCRENMKRSANFKLLVSSSAIVLALLFFASKGWGI